MQLLTIEGSGAFGQGAVFLLEGKPKAAGRVTNNADANALLSRKYREGWKLDG